VNHEHRPTASPFFNSLLVLLCHKIC
jgi:hypothetical protein